MCHHVREVVRKVVRIFASERPGILAGSNRGDISRGRGGALCAEHQFHRNVKIHEELRPRLATPNQMRLDLRTMVLRDYGKSGRIPTLVDAPHAGHTAMIADYHDG
jgi:hypothetical protein